MHNSKHTTKTVEILLPTLMFALVFRNRGPYTIFLVISNPDIFIIYICVREKKYDVFRHFYIHFERQHMKIYEG